MMCGESALPSPLVPPAKLIFAALLVVSAAPLSSLPGDVCAHACHLPSCCPQHARRKRWGRKLASGTCHSCPCCAPAGWLPH
eukprot:3492135-Prymnesium_polylepis.1